MGKLNDLKLQMYGDFINWLEGAKIGDCFSNDIWGSKVFDNLYQLYEDNKKMNRTLEAMKINELEQYLIVRKSKESKIIQPNKKIIK